MVIYLRVPIACVFLCVVLCVCVCVHALCAGLSVCSGFIYVYIDIDARCGMFLVWCCVCVVGCVLFVSLLFVCLC